ncbi:hypothetical protein CCP2SC5_500017 [Azospirillaceae bacterium]
MCYHFLIKIQDLFKSAKFVAPKCEACENGERLFFEEWRGFCSRTRWRRA